MSTAAGLIAVRCFDSLAAAGFLRDAVNALNLQSARPDPFSTFEFFENVVRHDEFYPAGESLPLWFLAAFDGDRLVGYLALRRVAHKTLWVTTPALGFLVRHDTDRPHVVARPDDVRPVSEAFCAYLLARGSEWRFLELQQQDITSALYPLPAAVDFTGYRVREWPGLENWTIHVRWNTLREYFLALSKKARSNVGRQMRGLFGAGNVELLASSDPVTNAALFELYRGIEQHSWKAGGDVAIGRHPERVEYVAGLLDASQPMRVTIHILLLDGTPVAGLISGAFMRGLYALHIVYDRRIGHLGPGSAMLLLAMRQAIDSRFAFLNLLSGFGYYKARWLAEVTETRIAQIYRAGSLLSWRRQVGDWKRRLLASPSRPAPRLFNPTRRAVDASQSRVGANRLLPLQASGAEHARFTALISTAKNGPGEFLSSAQLAAVMPFETRPTQSARGTSANPAVTHVN